MAFQSILFRSKENLLNGNKVEEKAPEFFPDLNLDHIKDAITSNKEAC